jgi:hypothetical protein
MKKSFLVSSFPPIAPTVGTFSTSRFYLHESTFDDGRALGVLAAAAPQAA